MKVVVNCIGKFIQEIDINDNDIVSNLKEKIEFDFTDKISEFIYKGCLLSCDNKLLSYGLNEFDHIILITKDKKKELTTITLDSNNVSNSSEYQNLINSFAAGTTNIQPNTNNNPAPPSPVQPQIPNTSDIPPEILQEATNALNILMDAGFPLNRAQKALMLNNMDTNAAMEWLLEHIDDPSIDDPIDINNMLTPGEEIKNCINSMICTYCVTGPVMTTQPWFECVTCGLTNGTGCCAVCVKVCHKDHEVIERRNASCFCDCGQNGGECKAKTNGSSSSQ